MGVIVLTRRLRTEQEARNYDRLNTPLAQNTRVLISPRISWAWVARANRQPIGLTI